MQAHNRDITISDLEIMANANNYRNWIYRQIAPFIGQRILEVGAGIGNFTELLLDRELVIATDKHAACLDYLKTRFDSRLKAPPAPLDLGDPTKEALDNYELDTVICLNVLEHVQDDLRALSYIYDLLQAGGRLLLLVPAFSFLFGSVDRALGHYRRYDKRDLQAKVCQAGFRVEHARYMNMIGMTGWFVNNRVLMLREESLYQIYLFDRFIAPWAERLERLIRPPVGLSAVVICRKP